MALSNIINDNIISVWALLVTVVGSIRLKLRRKSLKLAHLKKKTRYGRTHSRTDGRTDRPSCRDTWHRKQTRLRTSEIKNAIATRDGQSRKWPIIKNIAVVLDQLSLPLSVNDIHANKAKS